MLKRCSSCHVEKPRASFYRDLSRKDGCERRCKDCSRIHVRRFQQSPSGKSLYRWSNIRTKYGLTQDDYNEMLRAQGETCALCGRKQGGNRFLAVDHNHRTGKVRALLCSACNTGLGKFGDSPERLETAATYLRKHR